MKSSVKQKWKNESLAIVLDWIGFGGEQVNGIYDIRGFSTLLHSSSSRDSHRTFQGYNSLIHLASTHPPTTPELCHLGRESFSAG